MHLRSTFSYLQEDIEVPQYVGKLHGGPYLWIAPKGHYGKKCQNFQVVEFTDTIIFFNEQFCLDFF